MTETRRGLGVVHICWTHQLCLVLSGSRGVTEGVEEHLGVTVDGHKGLDVAVRCHKVCDGLDLGLRVSAGSMVRLRAGVAAGTGTLRRHNIQKRQTKPQQKLNLV